jgi:hypothetical protein
LSDLLVLNAVRTGAVDGSVQNLLCFWGRANAIWSGDQRRFLEELHVAVSLGWPFGAGDVSQPGRGQVECGLTIGESDDPTASAPDLAYDALQRIVVLDPTPVLVEEGITNEHLVPRRVDPGGNLGEARGPECLGDVT